MFWVIFIIILALIAAALDSVPGKIVAGATVIGIGLRLLSWITEITFLISLAKACAVVIVIVIAGSILAAIFG